MRKKHDRTPGRKPLQLTHQETVAIHCFYFNSQQPKATIAAAVGLTSAELSRLLKLKAGRELFDFLLENFEPECRWPEFLVTGPESVPPAMFKLPEPPPIEYSRGPSCEEVLKQLGFGPRKPKDGTDA